MSEQPKKQWYMLTSVYEQSSNCDPHFKITCHPGDVVAFLDRNKCQISGSARCRAFLFPQMIEIEDTHVYMKVEKRPEGMEVQEPQE